MIGPEHFFGGAVNVNRCNISAVGASVNYIFGPVQLTIGRWAKLRKRFWGTPQLAPRAGATKGFTAFAQLSY
jgi:hypothetical protein